MKTCIFAEKALMPDGVRRGVRLTIEDGMIVAMGGALEPGDLRAAYVSPGLLDTHIHGGFGFTVMRPTTEGYAAWLGELARHGVAGVLAGVHTAPIQTMREGVAVAARVMALQKAGEMGGARLLGVHLEGPFISQKALGAMDTRSVLAPSVENYEKIVGEYADAVRLITLAPEEEGALELTAYLAKRGVRVQAGHTAATDAQARRAFDEGVGGVCHTFNASPKIHHRAPGLLAEALTRDDVYCECICDFAHVYPTAVKMVYRLKGAARFIAITDAVKTAGYPDGTYEDGGETVYVRGGASYMPNGTLNGGGLTLDGAARNLVSLGIAPEDALTTASVTPARWLHTDFGTIAVGREAAVSAFDEGLRPLFVCLGGEVVGAARRDD